MQLRRIFLDHPVEKSALSLSVRKQLCCAPIRSALAGDFGEKYDWALQLVVVEYAAHCLVDRLLDGLCSGG